MALLFNDRKGAESFRLMIDLILLVVLLFIGGMFMSMSLSSSKNAIDDDFSDKMEEFSMERDMYSVLESSYSVNGVSYPLWYVLAIDDGEGNVVDSLVLEESLDSVYKDGYWVLTVFRGSGGSKSYGGFLRYSTEIETVIQEFEYTVPSLVEGYKIRLEVVS